MADTRVFAGIAWDRVAVSALAADDAIYLRSKPADWLASAEAVASAMRSQGAADEQPRAEDLAHHMALIARLDAVARHAALASR